MLPIAAMIVFVESYFEAPQYLLLRVVLIVIVILICTLLYAFIAYLYSRDYKAEFDKNMNQLRNEADDAENYRNKALQILDMFASSDDVDSMIQQLLQHLMETTKSCCAAFYSMNNTSGRLELKHSYGFSKNIYTSFEVSIGEGTLGYQTDSRRIQIIRDIPDDTMFVFKTVIGTIKPRTLMVTPVYQKDKSVGVIYLATLNDYSGHDTNLMEVIKQHLNFVIGNSLSYDRILRLSNELKFQNKLIQDMNADKEKNIQKRISALEDEIRISNERNEKLFNYLTNCVIVWSKGEQNEKVLSDARMIREKVFIHEQNVSYDDEMDGKDGECDHLVVYENDVPVATGRLYYTGKQVLLERVAVLMENRGGGLGSLVVRLLIQKAEGEGHNEQHVHSQTTVRGFYEKLGFKAYGHEYEKANIKHINMVHIKLNRKE
jgi:predicted GNAT family N-acyltransferase/cbb3-type cytochrome oxidase subunit 3